MSQEQYIVVPESFVHPLFYKSGKRLVVPQHFPELKVSLIQAPFYYDIFEAVHHLDAEKPWMDIDSYIDDIFEVWEATSDLLAERFRSRDRERARLPMIESTAWYLQLLFWVNGQPVPGVNQLTTSIPDLSIVPPNLEERLEFIFKKPDHYLSYTQLNQLFTETKNKFKASKQKN